MGNKLQQIATNTDDPIIKKKKDQQLNLKEESKNQSQDYNLENNLSVQVRGKYKCFKVNSNESQTFPVMISLKTEQANKKELAKEVDTNKPPIDLICVIDHSGSMEGEKMSLVKETLKMLLEFMTDQDRLCLIKFDDKPTKLTSLRRLTKDNIAKTFPQAINSIKADGGTNIALGMDEAFQVIKNRNEKNPVTSIFLLSDGLDGGAQNQVASSLNNLHIDDTFTIHTFGFGRDHDPNLMTSISKQKNGNFYYIEQLDKVDECFIDALAGLVSVVAQNVTLTVQPTFKGPFSDCKVSKYFGEMWKEQNYLQTISLTNLLSGVQKDFVMELNIPPIKQKLGDLERNSQFLEVTIEAQTVDQSHKVKKQGTLDITFYNEDEDVPNYEEDPDVMFNYLRVLAAENMKQARVQADKGNYGEADILMDQVMKEFDGTKKVDQAKLEVLRKDVIQTKQLCKPSVYSGGGKHQMMQMEECWMEQKTRGQKAQMDDVDMYENQVQFQMKKQVMSRKQK